MKILQSLCRQNSTETNNHVLKGRCAHLFKYNYSLIHLKYLSPLRRSAMLCYIDLVWSKQSSCPIHLLTGTEIDMAELFSSVCNDSTILVSQAHTHFKLLTSYGCQNEVQYSELLISFPNLMPDISSTEINGEWEKVSLSFLKNRSQIFL